jgi:hypothetical protein
MVSLPPTRSISRSCRTRRSLACIASGMSPTSSRKSVPPLARSNFPRRCLVAPVKAPASWPKSSLSMSSLGSAAQLSFSSGPFARGRERVDRARDELLPGPALARSRARSPRSWRARRSARRASSSGALPDELPVVPLAARRRLRLGLGAVEAERRLDRDEERVGVERLLEEVQRAEARTARTAVSMVACPLIMMTGVSSLPLRTARGARRRRRRGESRRRGRGRSCAS